MRNEIQPSDRLITRQKFIECAFITSVVAAGILLHPKVILADNSDIQIRDFPWKRKEILFGPASGFGTFPERPSILVGVHIDQDLDSSLVQDAMDNINALRRRRNGTNIFTQVKDQKAAQVRMVPSGDSNYSDLVVAYPDYKTLFAHCDARIHSPSLKILTHALMHTLGIVDFLRSSDNFDPHRINSQQSNLHGEPIDSIMSYGFLFDNSITDCLGKDDAKLLELAGYIKLLPGI